MMLTTFDGHVLQYYGGLFEEMPHPPGELGRGYIGAVDEDGAWWVVQTERAFIGSWDGTNWVKRFEVADLITGAGQGRDTGLWILAGTNLLKLKNGVQVERRNVTERPGGFWSLFEDKDGSVWISTYNSGLVRIARDGGFKRWGKTHGFETDNARAVMQDTEGNIWVGTSGSGLIRFKSKRFQSLGAAEGLPEINIRTVTEGVGGELLFGTYGRGLVAFDQKGARKVALPWEQPGDPRKNLFIHSVFVDSSGGTWVGAMDRGLCWFKGAEAKVFSHQHTGQTIWAIFEDAQRRVWVGGDANVSLFDEFGFESFGEEEGLRGHKFRCFAQDPEGRIWTASSEGLFCLQRERFEERKDRGRSIREVNCVLPGENGCLWLGTANSGLTFLRGDRAQVFGDSAGLRTKAVGGILDDQLGNFWLTSNRGIWRVNKNELNAVVAGKTNRANFIRLGLNDGLPALECSAGQQPNCLRDRQGRLWFATLKGVAMIDPKTFRLNDQPPRLYIDDLSYVDANGHRRHATPSEERIRIPAGSTHFEAHMAGLSYSQPETVTFFYRLKSGRQLVDEDFQSNDTLTSERLPFGAYELEVTAANSDGVLTPRPVSVAFLVQPFYWETAWFRWGGGSFGILSLVGGTWAGTRFRMRHQLERLRHQQAMATLQTRLAAVVESTTDLVAFASADGKVMFMNAAGRRLLKLSANEKIVGVSIARFQKADAFQKITSVGLHIAREKGFWSGENRLLASDRAEIPVSQVILAHRGGDGRIEFFSTIARDISERIRSEQAIRESEERYRTVFEYSPIGIAVSVDDRIVFVNSATLRMAGARDNSEIYGRSVYEFTTAEYHAEMQERRRKVIEGGAAAAGMEFPLVQLDGAIRHVEAYALRFAFAGKIAVLNFIVDITDRKKAEMEKEKTEQEFRELAARLMRIQDEERRRIGRELHDSTGQTLAALEINLGMLLRRLSGSGGQNADLIDECVQLATQCSGEIRTTSYLMHPPLLDEVGLLSALRWYADGFTKRSNIEVKLDVPETLQRFPQELELSLFRVVQEALTNIHRHSQSSSALIRLKVDGANIELEIADEGRGIDPLRLRLFREGHSNFGVGLSGMRERIRQLGGDLTVESNGKGTQVRVRAPIARVSI
jgi:PAS domain S-box-containing protein